MSEKVKASLFWVFILFVIGLILGFAHYFAYYVGWLEPIRKILEIY